MIVTCPRNTNCFRGSCIKDYQPACKVCGVCSAPTGFACVAERRFQMCVDNAPVSPVYECSYEEQCNPAGTEIEPCHRTLPHREQVVCPIGRTEVDRPMPPTWEEDYQPSASEFLAQLCDQMGQQLAGGPGNIWFPYDSTCTVYVKCSVNRLGTYAGELDGCQSDQLFDPSLRRCVAKDLYQCNN